MQDMYLHRNSEKYSETQIRLINYQFEAFYYKSFLASLHLEQLGAMSYSLDKAWDEFALFELFY